MVNQYSWIMIVTILVALVGCTSTKKIVGPGPTHGDFNLTPLLVLTNSSQLHYPGNDSIPPPDFVPYDTSIEASPRVLQRYNPDYPEYQLSNSIQADVWLKVWVNRNGHITQAAVFKSTDDNFNRSSAEAALKWVFKPGEIKGKPVSIWATIPFRFRIPENQ